MARLRRLGFAKSLPSKGSGHPSTYECVRGMGAMALAGTWFNEPNSIMILEGDGAGNLTGRTSLTSAPALVRAA
jgi:hypothetical protein